MDLSKLPENIKLEITKSDLIAFAKECVSLHLPNPEQPSQKDDLLTFDEMCTLLDIAKATGYTKTSKGELPHYKRGGKLYFKKSELIAWIEKGRKKTQKDIDELANQYLKKSHKE